MSSVVFPLIRVALSWNYRIRHLGHIRKENVYVFFILVVVLCNDIILQKMKNWVTVISMKQTMVATIWLDFESLSKLFAYRRRIINEAINIHRPAHSKLRKSSTWLFVTPKTLVNLDIVYILCDLFLLISQ